MVNLLFKSKVGCSKCSKDRAVTAKDTLSQKRKIDPKPAIAKDCKKWSGRNLNDPGISRAATIIWKRRSS